MSVLTCVGLVCVLGSGEFSKDVVEVAVAKCVAQTPPVATAEDAADDPAIWVNAANPGKSLVIGTNKKSGLLVYTLQGELVQELPVGRVNNVDVIHRVAAAGGSVLDVVVASNRTDDSVVMYRVNASAGRLEAMRTDRFVPGLKEVYGLCGYVDPGSGRACVAVNAKAGTVKIFEISVSEDGSVEPRQVREFVVGSQVEGLVADTTHGWLYVGEEGVGVWRYPLDPASETPRELVDSVSTRLGGHLARDVEGITLYELPDGGGYLIVSCQGEDRYAVYDRRSLKYVGSFKLALMMPDGTVENVTHTDGIHVTSAALGESFPLGAFVAQDDNAGKPQNFKIADWRAISGSLRLQQEYETPRSKMK